MLIFKKITWRNFLSTGNVGNTIDFNKHNSTLITGKNGEGKSTILCALTFVLFGKPFRNVSKAQLVNSINKKNCLVEIEFSVNGREYIVKRGIKPNIFEIWQDGEMVNQDAALKDYQKVLEQQILKLNYKTFTQVVILGSATFVPFMQLSSQQRREVIEDILDIKVFSIMNTILKEKSANTKQQITDIENEINIHKNKIASQKKLIEALETSKQNIVDSIQVKVDENNSTIKIAQTTIDAINKDLETLNERYAKHNDIAEAVSKASNLKVKTSTTIASCEHDIEFFKTNTTCPTCAQHIHEEHKQVILTDLNHDIVGHQAKLDQLNDVLTKLQDQLKSSQEVLEEIRNKQIELSAQNSLITLLNKQNTEMQQEINKNTQDDVNLVDEKSKMKEYAEEAISLVGKKSTLLDEKQLHDVASALLKDTGIKTAIIREYLPVMNKLINRYLDAMDFYVKFELDDSFQEVIKSRNRDVFTYDSFSEGEKRRLDLAILFTWRQIAKMKNSVNTNIMILDEILDGALDGAGIDYFLSIMNQFGEHTNVFVISHKVDQMIDRFEHVVRVEKKNDFSLITAA